jgi:hypothetical protein
LSAPTEKELEDAQRRVDSASEEAVSLALDALYDSALQLAIIRRAQRKE